MNTVGHTNQLKESLVEKPPLCQIATKNRGVGTVSIMSLRLGLELARYLEDLTMIESIVEEE